MSLQDKINAFDIIEVEKKQVELDKEQLKKLHQTARLPSPSFWGHVLQGFIITSLMFLLAWLIGCVQFNFQMCSLLTSFPETLFAMLIIPLLVSPLLAKQVVKEKRAEIARAKELIKYLDGEK